MLRLQSLEVAGFGPFADPQRLEFPQEPGVTVIYGANMRGKTSLLNAIRYALYGTVLGRGSRQRGAHSMTNRDLAAEGRFGFNVSLSFEADGTPYELVRDTRPRRDDRPPSSDEDYVPKTMLERDMEVVGPGERDKILRQVLPEDISRFFLFDGELLQEYEELLYDSSDAGRKISAAIEQILGVPLLKRARSHVAALLEDTDQEAARSASQDRKTAEFGAALGLASDQRKEHKASLARLEDDLKELETQKKEAEAYLRANKRHDSAHTEKLRRKETLADLEKRREFALTSLRSAMSNAWRTMLDGPVRELRAEATAQAAEKAELLTLQLRREAVESGRCGVCETTLEANRVVQLKKTLGETATTVESFNTAMRRLSEIEQFQRVDVTGQVGELSRQLQEIKLAKAAEKDALKDLETELADADEEMMRSRKTSLLDIGRKIETVEQAILDTTQKIEERDNAIKTLKAKLTGGSSDLQEIQVRADLLRDLSVVLEGSVEKYKSWLRERVEETASKLFLLMTTEKEDYAGLSINDSYGLSIRHKDGTLEDGRSAGAEHIVASALLGALQANAPLRGPIVMDSPFGRLDPVHTANVVRTLPEMAEQVVLFVHEKEVSRQQVRELLGSKLLREYELLRVNARRTAIEEVK